MEWIWLGLLGEFFDLNGVITPMNGPKQMGFTRVISPHLQLVGAHLQAVGLFRPSYPVYFRPFILGPISPPFIIESFLGTVWIAQTTSIPKGRAFHKSIGLLQGHAFSLGSFKFGRGASRDGSFDDGRWHLFVVFNEFETRMLMMIDDLWLMIDDCNECYDSDKLWVMIVIIVMMLIYDYEDHGSTKRNG